MHAQFIVIDSTDKRDRAVKWLARIPVDEVMELTLRPYKPTRSEVQNRRYFKIISLIAEHTGHDKDELHQAMKARFLGTTTVKIGDQITEVPKSSANLRTKEFADFSDRVEAWMIETLGIWME